MMLVKGAVIGYFTQRFTEVVLSFTEALWRLKALRFRGNSYDAGERRCVWLFYTEIRGGCIELRRGFNPFLL